MVAALSVAPLAGPRRAATTTPAAMDLPVEVTPRRPTRRSPARAPTRSTCGSPGSGRSGGSRARCWSPWLSSRRASTIFPTTATSSALPGGQRSRRAVDYLRGPSPDRERRRWDRPLGGGGPPRGPL